MKAYLQIPATMSEQTVDRIRANFNAMYGENIEYYIKTVPSLLGGFIAEVGGRVYDCSLSTKLENLRQRMLDEP